MIYLLLSELFNQLSSHILKFLSTEGVLDSLEVFLHSLDSLVHLSQEVTPKVVYLAFVGLSSLFDQP